MRLAKALLLTSLLLTALAPMAMASDGSSGMKIVNISYSDRKEVANIANMGFDIAQVGEDFVTVVTSDEELARAGFGRARITTVMENADDMFAPFKGRGGEGAYHSYEEAVAAMKEAEKKYPKIAKYSVVGKSCEGRDIPCLKISDNVATDEDEPEAMFMGLHHAREWITVEVPLDIMKRLLEGYGKDAQMTKMVNERETFIFPVVNPDGLVYSQTQYKMWRKNRRKNEGTSNMGVDLNRNYGYQWGNVGASSSAYSDTYHGTGPFSEPEACAMRDFAKAHKITASISFHSYSELILYPYGYGYNIPNPDEEIFIKLAKGMAKFSGYNPQNSAELYPAMGDSDDWFYGNQNILCFTFELGRTFVPSESEIPSICKKNSDGALWLLDQAGQYYPRVKPDKFERLTMNGALDEFKALSVALATSGAMMDEREYLTAFSSRRLLASKIVNDALAGPEDWEAFTTYVGNLGGDELKIVSPVAKMVLEYLNTRDMDGTAGSEIREKAEKLSKLLN